MSKTIPKWLLILVPILIILNVFLWTIPIESSKANAISNNEFTGPIHDVLIDEINIVCDLPVCDVKTPDEIQGLTDSLVEVYSCNQEEMVVEEITNSWSYMVPSIESQLGNRPLAAYSNIIARSCLESGMDPYWFCTIAILESGGGADCFKPYNAWGYGSYSWLSWEESIPEFCNLFVSGYGSGLNSESHTNYCPGGAYYDYV